MTGGFLDTYSILFILRTEKETQLLCNLLRTIGAENENNFIHNHWLNPTAIFSEIFSEQY